MKRVVLVRHGESEWNVERRIQGQSGTGLSARGHQQSAVTARWLVDAYPDATLLTSDLQRCVETARPAEEAFGRECVRDLGLRERDFGSWTGRLAVEVAEEYPDVWRRWAAGEDVIAELGGEGSEVFGARVVAALQGHLETVAHGETLLCFTHGGPVWHGTRGLIEASERLLGGVSNTSVTELLLDDAWGVLLSMWNATSHLPRELRGEGSVATSPKKDAPEPPPVGV